MGQHWFSDSGGVSMDKRSNEAPQVRRSVGEWVADGFSLLVVGGVVAAVFYLGFLL